MAAPHELRSPSLVDPPAKTPTPSIAIPGRQPSPSVPTTEYQRSASYTYLPQSGLPSQARRGFFVGDSFSEDDLITTSDPQAELSSAQSSGWTTPEEYPSINSDNNTVKNIAAEVQRNPKIAVHRLLEVDEPPNDKNSTSHESTSSLSSAGRARQRNSGSTSLSHNFKRRSWYSIATTPDSRSPSPPKQEATNKHGDAIEEEEATVGAFDDDRADHITSVPSIDTGIKRMRSSDALSSRPNTSGRSSLFSREHRRPISIISITNHERSSSLQAMPYMPKSFSTDKLSGLLGGSSLPTSRMAPPSRLGSSGGLSAITSASRKKDELWGAFRTLDGDYSKFISKSITFRASVVRTTILPFLRNYADHPSTFSLRAEDLERRVNILNKWWTALIEMVHGRNNQSLHGTDRPVILDAMSGIMSRPEWRLPPSPFCAVDLRLRGGLPRDRSMSSLSSMATDSQWESVHRNVQNLFIQNLRVQMAFVVDKLSLKHAAATLVTFCGKACAYGFVFVPGIADVLVRLWDVQSDHMQRVLCENGVDRLAQLSHISDDVMMMFPPCLHQLEFSTLAAYSRKLRTPPSLPPGTTNIQWWGFWNERWSGRESDLFYVFAKHYHLLVAEFLPAGTTKAERMCVPGMLPVHSQILKNLDITVHRQTNKPSGHDLVGADSASNIDDIMVEPDAVLTPLPTVPVNARRNMAENRLIMLVRDFLSERTAAHPEARQIFAEAVNDLLQAVTRGVSVYDASACYTLLDLAEEALTILVKYEHLVSRPGSLINAEFWHLVSRKMIASENTLTEMRLYAWLYTIWSTIVSDLGRKADLCLGLLLDPGVFARSFNHWSPMVRAYFMRLLCWRVARFDGEDLPGDFAILETLLERLQMTFRHHLWYREQNAGSEPFALIANPCNPAPHRKLRIMRYTPTASTAFSSFDVIEEPMVPPKQKSARGPRGSSGGPLSTLSSVSELENAIADINLDGSPSSPVGLRSFIHRVVGGKSRSHGQSSGGKTPPIVGSIPIPGSRRLSMRPTLSRSATDDSFSAQSSATNSGSSTPTVTVPTGGHVSHWFRFQMEYNMVIKQPGPIRLIPPRLPAPAQEYLAQYSDLVTSNHVMEARRPIGLAKRRVAYCGRALAEWALVVGECQSFFERRMNEGAPSSKAVETPTLSVEVFKRPS